MAYFKNAILESIARVEEADNESLALVSDTLWDPVILLTVGRKSGAEQLDQYNTASKLLRGLDVLDFLTVAKHSVDLETMMHSLGSAIETRFEDTFSRYEARYRQLDVLMVRARLLTAGFLEGLSSLV